MNNSVSKIEEVDVTESKRQRRGNAKCTETSTWNLTKNQLIKASVSTGQFVFLNLGNVFR